MPAYDPDDEATWYCMFCGQLIGPARPFLYGEVTSDGTDHTTFAAHPRCFMASAHESIREEGYFDPDTFLPVKRPV